MNALFFILGALFVIVSVFSMVLDHHLKGLPSSKRTAKQERLRSLLLACGLGVFVLNQGTTIVKDNRRAKEASEERTSYSASLSTVSSNQLYERRIAEQDREAFHSQVSNIMSKQITLQLTLQAFATAVATNTSISPATRSALIEAKQKSESIFSDVVDIDAWVTELQNKRLANKARIAQIQERATDRTRPVFNYALETLKIILSDLAKQKHDQVTSTLADLPSVISSDLQLGVIRMETNSMWTFDVSISASRTSSDYAGPALRIETHSGEGDITGLRISCTGGGVSVSVFNRRPMPYDPNQYLPEGCRATLSDYRSCIDTQLRTFLALSAEQLAKTNNSVLK